jgi:hypothetical protein
MLIATRNSVNQLAAPLPVQRNIAQKSLRNKTPATARPQVYRRIRFGNMVSFDVLLDVSHCGQTSRAFPKISSNSVTQRARAGALRLFPRPAASVLPTIPGVVPLG